MNSKFLFLITIFLISMIACQKDKSKTMIIHNITGYTIQGDSLISFNAMAFANGKVLDQGNYELLKDKYPDAKSYDGGGKVLLPGLIDAHGHVLGLGYSRLDVDLVGTRSLSDALQRVADYDKKYPVLNWIRGRGWNQELWTEDKFPTAKELDNIVSDRPVWLVRVDGHAGWANSKALEEAHLTKDTKDPVGGKIMRDTNGNPTGILVDHAMDLMEKILPARTEHEDSLALEEALDRLREVGLTSVGDAGIPVSTYNLYKKFVDQRRMTSRIYAMILMQEPDFKILSKNGPVTSYGNDLLSLQSVKIYSDGALGSRGAAMLRPYSDDPGNKGLLFHTQDELNKMVDTAVSKGYQVNIHAIGDRANREVLDAFGQAEKKYGEHGLRNRVEHAQVVAPEDIPRFKSLHLIASMQPTHATSDKNMAVDRIGKGRMKGAYAWQTFEKQGTVVAGGSDFPVESANPFFGLYAAVTREDTTGNPPGGWYPEEKLSRLQAFKAFTINAAYAQHQENIIGSLEKGKWADFILVDKDYFKIPESDIWKIKVLETWLGGKKVYSKM